MNDAEKRYRNAPHALMLLLRNEGPTALYKGFAGCFIRLFPHTVLSLMILERLRSLAGLNPI